MIFLYGVNICYYFYSLWFHFSKVITATLKLFQQLKSDLDHYKADVSH